MTVQLGNLHYDRNQLIKSIKANREKHQKEYTEAVDIYRRDLVEALRDKLDDAEQGLEVDHSIDLDKPVQYLKEYDNAISMLENTTDLSIVLDPHTFAQLVLDQWSWSASFTKNTTSYISKSLGSR